jgi:hypothetical protein
MENWNINMVSRRLISLFTVTSLLSLLVLIYLPGCTEKRIEALKTGPSFASNINNTGKPSVLFSKLDGKAVLASYFLSISYLS